jgi:DNA-binding NtrC family response regulator
VNVRVIAATNKELDSEVRHGRFRADLYFRLRSVNVSIPPLRNRPSDIPILFRSFAEEVARGNGIQFEGISGEAIEILQSYRWPGNVRELRNVAESMVVLGKGKRIEEEDVRKNLKDQATGPDERNLPVHVAKSVEQAERELILRALLDIKGNIVELKSMLDEQRGVVDATKVHGKATVMVGDPDESSMSLQDMEHKMIAEALERSKGNRRMAARALDISERTLYRKIKEYHLE